MTKKRLVFIGAIAVSLLLLSSLIVTGDEVSDKLSRVISTRLGLEANIYRVIETEYQGERVILIAIFGNKRALNSSLGSDIKTGIRNNLEKNPVAISVLTRNKDAQFHPYALRIVQGGEKKRPKDIIGVTNSFQEGAMPEKVPIEGEVFWGSKGVVTLGESFDSSSSFTVEYGTSGASFSLADQTKEESEQVTSQEERQKVESETKKDSPQQEGISGSGSQIGGSKTGEGAALLASLATLLSITFSFL